MTVLPLTTAQAKPADDAAAASDPWILDRLPKDWNEVPRPTYWWHLLTVWRTGTITVAIAALLTILLVALLGPPFVKGLSPIFGLVAVTLGIFWLDRKLTVRAEGLHAIGATGIAGHISHCWMRSDVPDIPDHAFTLTTKGRRELWIDARQGCVSKLAVPRDHLRGEDEMDPHELAQIDGDREFVQYVWNRKTLDASAVLKAATPPILMVAGLVSLYMGVQEMIARSGG